MPVFQYEAMNAQGKMVRDEIEARDENDATSRIRDLNLFPTRITEKKQKKTTQAQGPAATDPTRGAHRLWGDQAHRRGIPRPRTAS